MRRPIDLTNGVYIGQTFGEMGVDYAQFGLRGHHGCDYPASVGRPVYAPEPGVVTTSSNGVTDRYTGRRADGQTIIMEGSYEHWLMHLNERLVGDGQRVDEGQLIGYSGNTGFTTGPHLHWGTRPLNPDINNGFRGFVDPATVLVSAAPTPPPTPTPELLLTQRLLVNKLGVNQRKQPTTDSEIIKEWGYDEGGDNVYNFKGYVIGQDAYGDGNMTWFVGAASGGYFHSSNFQGGAVTTGLANLTPTPSQPTPETPPPVFPGPTTDSLVTRVINKRYPVGAAYAPEDLTMVGNGQSLRTEAANSLKMMQDAANGLLTPASGYRSYDHQKSVYDAYVKAEGREKADTYSARPGYSEHQTGLAMDFSPIEDTFKDSQAYSWLVDNGYKYGWVLRYPEGKEPITGYMYEPWHWRYVGVEAAADMRSRGTNTLEEYYGVEGGAYVEEVPLPTPLPEPTPTPPNDIDKENNAMLKRLLELVQQIVDKLKNIFR